MEIRALIIEDDDRIVRSIEDALYSLGHVFESVASQEEAIDRLGEDRFDYVLLDLHIPARRRRGGASTECGANLLRHIRKRFSLLDLPVIVMTAHSDACVDLTTELVRLGANEFIAKPFKETGRTLASVIRKVLEPRLRSGSAQSDLHADAGPLRPFEGGELVFYPDRVELCSVKVCGDASSGNKRKILDKLREKYPDGRHRSFSGTELAQAAKAARGQNAAAEVIAAFRGTVVERLRRQRGIECGSEDVIETTGVGYRYTSKVTVRDASEVDHSRTESIRMSPAREAVGDYPVNTSDDPVKATHDPVFRSGNGYSDGPGTPDPPLIPPVHRSGDPVNDPVAEGRANQPIVRQRWALAQMNAGRPVRRRDIEQEFKVSPETAKRDLADLGDQIEFTGPPKTGYYRLKQLPRQAHARARRSAIR